MTASNKSRRFNKNQAGLSYGRPVHCLEIELSVVLSDAVGFLSVLVLPLPRCVPGLGPMSEGLSARACSRRTWSAVRGPRS